MRRDRDEGQAAVELALVLPLVVLLLLAVVQVTLVARDQILVVHAARNAARAAAVEAGAASAAAARNAALESLKSDGVRADVQRMGGDRPPLVVVHVRYDSATDVPLVGPLLPDVPLSAKAAMRAETPSTRDFPSAGADRRQEPAGSAANTAGTAKAACRRPRVRSGGGKCRLGSIPRPVVVGPTRS